MTTDEFGSLGMSHDQVRRAHAAIRRLTKECVAITRERVRRGERFDRHAVARGARFGIRGALIGLGLAEKQREAFLLFAAPRSSATISNTSSGPR